jgi:thiamine-monophosphate kinase
MDIVETELLDAIRRVLSGAGPEVVVGVGDDAAVVVPGSGELVLTTDALVEGTHFHRGSSTPRDLGCKAIVVSVSDIAAMAASPRFALCALALPDDVEIAWVMELFGGMREACDGYALTLVGGNLARGNQLSVTITVTGEVAPGRALTRAGARAGDHLVVTGDLGASAAGRRFSGSRTKPTLEQRAAIERHQRPAARVGEAAVLARHGASALIDVSDGLVLDLSRLVAASGLGARVRLRDVPVAPSATLEDALSGGEDYELVAAVSDQASIDQARIELRDGFGVELTDLGDVTDEPAVVVVEEDGAVRSIGPMGWDHFA